MAKSAKSASGRGIASREGYQGKPMPAGAKPPKGPALDVPVKKTTKRVK